MGSKVILRAPLKEKKKNLETEKQGCCFFFPLIKLIKMKENGVGKSERKQAVSLLEGV